MYARRKPAADAHIAVVRLDRRKPTAGEMLLDPFPFLAFPVNRDPTKGSRGEEALNLVRVRLFGFVRNDRTNNADVFPRKPCKAE